MKGDSERLMTARSGSHKEPRAALTIDVVGAPGGAHRSLSLSLRQWGCTQQDGRRAPIPDYFRVRRSVNTQTPARYSSCASGNGSDQSTSLSPSPLTLSPPPDQAPAPPDSPPGPPQLHAVIVSPHINKFLAREPPDGCERVASKPSDEK